MLVVFLLLEAQEKPKTQLIKCWKFVYLLAAEFITYARFTVQVFSVCTYINKLYFRLFICSGIGNVWKKCHVIFVKWVAGKEGLGEGESHKLINYNKLRNWIIAQLYVHHWVWMINVWQEMWKSVFISDGVETWISFRFNSLLEIANRRHYLISIDFCPNIWHSL